MHNLESVPPPLSPDLLADPRVHTTDTGYRIDAIEGEWSVDPADDGGWVAHTARSSRISHVDVNVLVRAILGGEALR